MPALELIRRPIENQQPLDECAADVACACHEHLPGDHAEPAGYVGEKFPTGRGREDGDPVVGAAGDGNHGGHFGHYEGLEDGADPGGYVSVD